MSQLDLAALATQIAEKLGIEATFTHELPTVQRAERIILEALETAIAHQPLVTIALDVLMDMAKDAIKRELPEDEPDTIPDWCYETILQTALAGIVRTREGRGEKD